MVRAGAEIAAPDGAFAQAQACLGRGDLAGAERVCRDILSLQPEDFRATYLLGIIAAQSRQHEEAAQHFARAAELRPDEPSTHNNQGNALLERKRYQASLACFERALQLRAEYPEAHYNRGNALRELGRLPEALESYDRALRLRPQFAEAHNNRGKVLLAQRRLEEARASFARAFELAPGNAQALTNLGVVLTELQCLNEALAAHERALQLAPDSATALINRGLTLQQLKRLEEALSSYESALRLDPADARAWYSRGGVLNELRRAAEADVSYQRALDIRPDYAEAHRNRGELHWEHRRYESALASYQSAVMADPELPCMCGNWIHAAMRVCQWSDWHAQVAALQERIERGQLAATPFAVLPAIDSPPLQLRAAAAFVRETCPPLDRLSPPFQRIRTDRIRVGYYSADYHEHPVARLTAALFERHDRQRFEVIGFSIGPDSADPMRLRLQRAFDQFVDVRRKSDREVAHLSRQLGIDIAVDLTGFTGNQRTGIFAQRAAPVQVNYLGYPGTMGAPFMDYILADRILIPPQLRPHYAERVVYLPHCYQVNESRPGTARHWSRAELGLPEDGFVFCAFNNVYKITPDVFALWMRVLRTSRGSVLWLATDIELAVANLRKAAEQHGVEPERLVFAGRVPLHAEHLSRYRVADLFLDTFPYNAHTTASDALGSGLPVLSRPGQSFASRVAASMLHTVGLPELIADGQEHYERLAVELAQDPERLRKLRACLENERTTAPLFDVERFTRDLEAAYTVMHERRAADREPEDIFL